MKVCSLHVIFFPLDFKIYNIYFSIFKFSVCLLCHHLFTDHPISDLFFILTYCIFQFHNFHLLFYFFFFSAEKSSFHSLEHAFLYILEVNYNSPLTSMYVNSKSWVISRLVFIDCCFILLMGTFSCILLSLRYLECHIVENLDPRISKFVLNYELSFLVAPQILVQFFVLKWSVSHTCFRGKWEIWVEFTPASQGFYTSLLIRIHTFF